MIRAMKLLLNYHRSYPWIL